MNGEAGGVGRAREGHARSSLVMVTNNVRVAALLAEAATPQARFVDGTPLDVLACVCEMLQEGHTLVSAPLPPNVPMMRAPFRTLIVARSERRYDVAGIRAVERAREVTARQRAITCADGRGAGANDFALIDERYALRALRDYFMLQGL